MELEFNDFEIDVLNNIPKIPCVYILMLDNEARYVGQTNNLYHRINYGHLAKIFNRILFVKCPNKKLRLLIENDLMEYIYPLYNHFSN